MRDPLFDLLIPIADGSAPLPLFPVNVRRSIGEPMFRRLRSVRWLEGQAIRWEWHPEPRDDGRPDCGYSVTDLEAA